MTKTEALEKAQAGEINAEILTALTSTDNDSRIASLEARLEASEGKSNGILGDKKKAQEKATELQAKIDALESKDLGEVETLKRDMERLQSKFDLSETTNTELKATYETEKRDHALNKIAGEFKWMDSVPKDMRSLIVSNAMEGIDLGNDVLVADKVKGIRETYAGQLASDAPNGAGSKPGNNSQQENNAPVLDKMAGMSDKDILKNSAQILTEAHAVT